MQGLDSTGTSYDLATGLSYEFRRNTMSFIDDADRVTPLLPAHKLSQRVAVGKITRFLSIKCDGETRPWMELELGERLDDTDLGYMRFALGATRCYVPLGWGDWTVARRVSLAHDPTDPRCTLINHRVRWYLGDRWPAKRLWDDTDDPSALEPEDQPPTLPGW